MFGSDDNDEDDQRWWNLILLHIPCTDKELEDMGPFCLGLVVVIVIVCVIYWAVK